MSLSDFAKLNERRAEAGLSTFMNPRNSAAGTIRQLDPKLAADRPAVDSGATRSERPRGSRSTPTGTRSSGCARTASRSIPTSCCCETEDEVIARCRGLGGASAARSTSRSTASVVKVNEVELQRRPRVGRARAALGDRLEVPADHRGHEAQADRLEPRQVRRPAPLRDARAGARRRRDREAGDAAQRGGPRAQGHPRRRGRDRAARRRRDPAGPLARRRTSPSARTARRRRSPPARCPVCDTPTVKPEGSVFTRCPNRDCPGRRWQLLKHFVGRDGHRRPGREAGRACSWSSAGCAPRPTSTA